MEEQKEAINVGVVVGVVVRRDGKFLLVQEKSPKIYGLWNFPAGHVDVGESLEQAAIREAKEESGYNVEIIKELAIFHAQSTDPIKHAFEGKIVGGELKFPEDEILDAKWFALNEIKQMKDKLRGGWILETISILESR